MKVTLITRLYKLTSIAHDPRMSYDDARFQAGYLMLRLLHSQTCDRTHHSATGPRVTFLVCTTLRLLGDHSREINPSDTPKYYVSATAHQSAKWAPTRNRSA